MDLSDINPVPAIGGLIGGIFSVMLAQQMMPSSGFGVLVKLLTFGATSVVCYLMLDKMFS
jgi:hypothetical protein